MAIHSLTGGWVWMVEIIEIQSRNYSKTLENVTLSMISISRERTGLVHGTHDVAPPCCQRIHEWTNRASFEFSWLSLFFIISPWVRDHWQRTTCQAHATYKPLSLSAFTLNMLPSVHPRVWFFFQRVYPQHWNLSINIVHDECWWYIMAFLTKLKFLSKACKSFLEILWLDVVN